MVRTSDKPGLTQVGMTSKFQTMQISGSVGSSWWLWTFFCRQLISSTLHQSSAWSIYLDMVLHMQKKKLRMLGKNLWVCIKNLWVCIENLYTTKFCYTADVFPVRIYPLDVYIAPYSAKVTVFSYAQDSFICIMSLELICCIMFFLSNWFFNFRPLHIFGTVFAPPPSFFSDRLVLYIIGKKKMERTLSWT